MQLLPSSLPSEENIVFKDSSFFKQEKHITLPLPSEVRAATDTKDPRYGTGRAQIVHFPSLHLTVKWGREETIAEGQCLWAIRHQLSGAVPVPEVYGWCREGSIVYIYMELVRGVTLEERWDSLSPDKKSQVCEQLKGIVAALSSLEQDPDDKFIGNIAKQPVLDIIFTSSCAPPAGPFPDVTSFLNFFTHPHTYDSTSSEPPHPMRSQLIDDVPIRFTHGDLCRSNIMISSEEDGLVRIVAIIDWHQSGWLPAYWEFCKARWTTYTGDGEDWEVEYIPRFLETYEQYDYWGYFVTSLGV